MNKRIALITSTALWAVIMNIGFAQPQLAEIPEPPEPPEAPEAAALAAAYNLTASMFGSGNGTAGRTLIIPKETADPKQLMELEEDLNVMARILEKAATGTEGKNRQAMGIWIHGGWANPALPKNLCIEGYGALFFLNVNFPLLPPAANETETESTDKTSTEWEEARRELYRTPGKRFEPIELNLRGVPGLGGPVEEYNSDKVEDLKRNVIGALKNAAHIRDLKSDDVVTVIISGRNTSTDGKVTKRTLGGSRNTASPPIVIVGGSQDSGPGTRLILRARMADIDSFQKDKLSLEDFRKKVTAIAF